MAETEKAMLTQNLKDSQYAVEKSQAELQSFIARIVQLGAHVQSLQHIHSKLPEKQNDETTLDKLNLVNDKLFLPINNEMLIISYTTLYLLFKIIRFIGCHPISPMEYNVSSGNTTTSKGLG